MLELEELVLLELELVLDDEELLEELELLPVPPQLRTSVQEKSLPGTVLVYQLA